MTDVDGRGVERVLCGSGQMLGFPMERAGPVVRVKLTCEPMSPARISIKKILIK